jgi:ubiquinone biosynthesis protein
LDPGYRVPKVEWPLTARDVLTMEWIDGIRLSDLAALRGASHDLPTLARRLMQSFLRQALRDGFFHADMHQGNFLVDPSGNLVAFDFGIMGRLSRNERRFLAEILYGFVTRDYRRVAEVHFEAGYVPKTHAVDDFTQAIRAIGEPIHGQKARDISMARLLALLFEMTEVFDMATRPELILVQKTMVVVEGVARSLDPDFDMWATAEPILREWIERHLGPAGQLELAAEGVGALGRLAGELPRLAERAERLSADFAAMSDRGIRLDPETIDGIARAQRRGIHWGWIALAGSAVVMALVVLRLALWTSGND